MTKTMVTVCGNLVDDPELRFTPGGDAVCNFRVAVNPREKNAAGDWVDGEATFYAITAWRQKAENVAESLTKGMKVIIYGAQRVRSYERRDGTKGQVLEVDAEDIGPSLTWGSTKFTGNPRSNSQPAQQQTPAQQPAANSAPAYAGGQDPWGAAPTDEPPF